MNIPDIAHMTTNAAFPIESDTVIEIKCNHPWFTLSGVEEITCVLDWTYNYNGGREPSCTKGEPFFDVKSYERRYKIETYLRTVPNW